MGTGAVRPQGSPAPPSHTQGHTGQCNGCHSSSMSTTAPYLKVCIIYLLIRREQSAKVRGGDWWTTGLPRGGGVSSATCLALVSQTAGVWCTTSPYPPPCRRQLASGVKETSSAATAVFRLDLLTKQEGRGWWVASQSLRPC